MAVERKPEPDTSGSVPSWFMTYSDVITLLMTFFILLLTFATNEPETFHRMQVNVFGGGGATGFASDADGPQEKDSLVIRVRPDSSRISTQGSQQPPLHSERARASLNEGLKSLQDEMRHEPALGRSIQLAWASLVSDRQDLTPFGEQIVRMISSQLGRYPMQLKVEVFNAEQLPQAVTIGLGILARSGATPGRVGVSYSAGRPDQQSQVRLTMTRLWNHDKK